ncbi:MAG: methyl-accepting chemotaxis protein [Cyanobacteria bacterium P01_F01_bin.42]
MTAVSPISNNGDIQLSSKRSLIQQLQSNLQARLVPTITVSVLFSLALTGGSIWNTWRIYHGLQNTVTRQFKLKETSKDVVYLDEVLTMSARMAASTGKLGWQERYDAHVPLLDQALGEILDTLPEAEQTNPAKTNAANDRLIAYENQAFELVRQGKSDQALSLLLSRWYRIQKIIYSQGINGTLTTINQKVDNQLQAYQHRLAWSMVTAVASLLLLAATWSIVLLVVQKYIRDRRRSQSELEASERNLHIVNDLLTCEADQRRHQEEQILEQSDLLQADVSHILEVVSSLENGNLTIQAEVSERATGLVSSTLNRLIQSLNGVVSSVIDTAQQVTNGTQQLEDIAVETAEQAQAQTASIQQVQGLMNAVNELSSDSLQQATATGQAVEQAKEAVMVGQKGMNDMGNGIDTLQTGTDQIVRRAQMLNDFVDLATQFSKGQKRVASLTKVLSLNASTLATRALKEDNPDQFASLAREFDAIARQVNDLATETNRGLIQLQQRTHEIQTVSSGLNHDVSEISQIVQAFIQDVSQARQAFQNIQRVTEQVEQLGQQVSYSSQAVVEVVQNTLTATQEIATIAGQTDAKAAVTRQQVEDMGNVAQTLLARVAFFQVDAQGDVTDSEMRTTIQSRAKSGLNVPAPIPDASASETQRLMSA